MNIQANSYDVMRNIGNRKSSSKNNNQIKNNKFEDNFNKVGYDKQIGEEKNSDNRDISPDETTNNKKNDDNKCELDNDKRNNSTDEIKNVDKNSDKLNELLQQLITMLKNDSNKTNEEKIKSILNDINELDLSKELTQISKTNKSLLNKCLKEYNLLESNNVDELKSLQDLNSIKLKELLDNKDNEQGNFEVLSKTTEGDSEDIDLYKFDNNRMDSFTSNNKQDNSSSILEKIASSNSGKEVGFGPFINKATEGQKNARNVIPKQIETNIMEDSIKTIKHMKSNDMQELTIKLRPKELGNMNIQLLKDTESMRAVVTVFNKDVFDSINKNITDLKQHLEVMNINVKDVSIQMHSDNRSTSDTFSKEFEQQNRQNTQENSSKQGTSKDRDVVISEEIVENNIDDDRVDLLA